MNKSSIAAWVGLVVGLLALVLGAAALAGGSSSQSSSLAGVVYNTPDQYTAGISLGTLPVRENFAGGKIGPKLNQAFWKNTSGVVQYVDLVEISTDGTASTSFKAYVSTSTTATLGDGAAPNGALVNGTTIATSSKSVTVNNISTTIQVPTGQYVVFQFESLNASPIGETATSTARGFNVQWRLHHHD